MKNKSDVKMPLGMRGSWFFPIKDEPENAHPIYEDEIDMGTAVKGYLSITTASASIPGDDKSQVDFDIFVSAQLDAETTMNDLEVNAKIYGHHYEEEAGELSKSSDSSIFGGYAFVEPILLKNKTLLYRATCLYKVSALASSEKQEADTKKPGELSPKNNVVSYKVVEDNTESWRQRKDFETYAAAVAFIRETFKKPAE